MLQVKLIGAVKRYRWSNAASTGVSYVTNRLQQMQEMFVDCLLQDLCTAFTDLEEGITDARIDFDDHVMWHFDRGCG
jgi:hypothetical protein